MLDTVEYVGYHATDERNVESIIQDGFRCKKNKTHWLGNGIYFFEDKQLAYDWAANVPQGYGEINKPAIIEVLFRVPIDRCCDLRKIHHYNKIREAFEIFMEEYYKHTGTFNKTLSKIKIATIRCSFFDWVSEIFDIDIIIAYFQKYRGFYIYGDDDICSAFQQFRIPYIEVQYSVFSNDIIVEKNVLDSGGKEDDYEFRSGFQLG